MYQEHHIRSHLTFTIPLGGRCCPSTDGAQSAMRPILNPKPRPFPEIVGPSHRAGLGYCEQREGCILRHWGRLGLFLATSEHPVPAQPLRTIKTWPFSGLPQDTTSISQNKSSAFPSHGSSENLMAVQMLSPEKCACPPECGELQNP